MRRLSANIFLVRAALLPAAILGVALRAQDAADTRAPLSQPKAPGLSSDSGVSLAAAQRAQDFGLPGVAADIYRQLRDQPGIDRVTVNLALATTLLDASLPAEAEKALAEIPPPHNAAWRLRAGLAAFQRGERAAAQSQWDSIREDEVPAPDRPWYWFFTAVLYDTATPRDVRRANTAYTRAESEASTELAKARFQLAGEFVRLEKMGTPSPDEVEQARRSYEQARGSATAYGFAEQYAAKLDMIGRKTDAVPFLQREILLTLPRHETAWRDKFNFLLGLIDDRGKGIAGRAALTQLLETGLNPQRQRQALQLLAEASRDEPARREFKSELTKLISARTPHPILESLYYFRSQFALVDREYIQAEEDANALLKQFPLSSIRVHALVILTQAAWEQGRYRVAAENARKARGEMTSAATGATGAAAPAGAKPPPAAMSPRLRANLGVLEAEARFRATDYRSAADAYSALLTERPPELGGRLGELMFQHVLAEIKAGSSDAAKVLDRHESDPAFDLENRWQAEWSLARALQVKGPEAASEAFKRVTALLQEPNPSVGGMKPDLRAKMAWLHTKLAFDSGDSAQTIRLADGLLANLPELERVLRNEISSTLLLFKVQSEFALGREAAAIETLKRLRAEFAANDAAIQSYLIEAEYFAAQDKIDEARNRLIALTDNAAYKDSPYKPYALYRLALLSERLGRKENLEEANQRIEDLLKIPSATRGSTLYFAARMRQGDIFRKRDDFPAAQQAYEDLVKHYAQHPNVVLAQLALADCYNLQSSAGEGNNPHVDSARLIYERLLDRLDAPRDVRIEAGYKLGALLARTGKTEAAVKVWWSDVADKYLIREKPSIEPGAKRPYWLARTLCELGELQEKRGRFDEAKAAYILVLESGLPGGAIASAKLQQLNSPAAKNGQ